MVQNSARTEVESIAIFSKQAHIKITLLLMYYRPGPRSRIKKVRYSRYDFFFFNYMMSFFEKSGPLQSRMPVPA